MNQTLGCVGCPCSQTCGGSKPAGLAGLGCSCLGCPSAATCSRSQIRGALGDLSLDYTDPKTLIIGALILLLAYNLLFRKDQRDSRSRVRKARAAARDRYAADLVRIKAAA